MAGGICRILLFPFTKKLCDKLYYEPGGTPQKENFSGRVSGAIEEI